jgi:hypothetical protein
VMVYVDHEGDNCDEVVVVVVPGVVVVMGVIMRIENLGKRFVRMLLRCC